MISSRRHLITALFLLALAGLMLHYRIHNFMAGSPLTAGPAFNSTLFLSFLLPLIDVTLVTLLFCFRKTSVYGYLFNGILVIYGTVLMSHYSIAELTSKEAPIKDWILSSTIPDIGISWGDFFIGKVLYELDMKS